MPVFNGPNCLKKIAAWMVLSIILTMGLIYYIGSIFGLIGATIVLLISLVVVWYLIDIFGDVLFTDRDYQPNKTEIDQYKEYEFHYQSRF